MIELGSCYRTKRTIVGLKLVQSRSEEGTADFLPAGSIVQVRHPAQFYKMLEVMWGNEYYAVFEEDLMKGGDEVSKVSNRIHLVPEIIFKRKDFLPVLARRDRQVVLATATKGSNQLHNRKPF